jgi:predicted metal-dependent enzyme (double-stranded beta helix superfamily)
MTTTRTETALDRFIAQTRDLFAQETDTEIRWLKLTSILREFLGDPGLQEASKRWPECIVTDRAENLLFYVDPDYGFAVNGLKRLPENRIKPPSTEDHPTYKGIHDHGHSFALYGVLAGHEMIDRYRRVEGTPESGQIKIEETGSSHVEPGDLDLVRPYEIHAERSVGEETVAIIIRSEKTGDFLQGRYDYDTGKYWQVYGPRQTPVEMFGEG